MMRVAALRRLAPPRRVDLAIAAGLLAWGLPDVPWWWEYPGHAGSTPDVLGSLLLTLAMSAPFCLRRRFPVAVLVTAGAVLAIRMELLHRNGLSAFAAVLCAAYGLGAYSEASRRYARWLGWASLAVAVTEVLRSLGNRLVAVPAALIGAAFVLGDAASARRSETAAAVEAAHHAERTRIARELHDVVAHQLSAIAVQAGTARLLAQGATGTQRAPAGAAHARPGPPGGPGRSRAAPDGGPASAGAGPDQAEVLGTVERLSREALSELSHLLGALRREPGASPPPAPTLAGLGALVEASRAAGVPAELAVEGQPRPLPAGLELTCYRIISEALANVARHSPGAAARVTLGYRPGRVELDVVNTAPPRGQRPAGAPWDSPGLGLRGMRERAELYGGALAAGRCADGGFAVSATIPCGGAVPGPPGPVPPSAAGPSPVSREPAPPGAAGPPPGRDGQPSRFRALPGAAGRPPSHEGRPPPSRTPLPPGAAGRAARPLAPGS